MKCSNTFTNTTLSIFSLIVCFFISTLAHANLSLDHKNILETYQKKLKNFTWTSNSTLSIRNKHISEQKTGSSILVMDEKENFLLTRKLFSLDAPLTLSRLNMNTQLKLPHAQKAERTTFLSEFLRWQEQTLEEVLSLYREMDFEETLKLPPQINNGFHCWRIEQNQLCFDPTTELPVNGSLKIEVSPSAILDLNFIVRSLTAEQVVNIISDSM